MAEGKDQPIIVIKKKGGHGGHHGGAWKVAYADFVTAMMALFIVLWLLNTSQNVRDAIAGYFKDPEGNGRQAGSALAGVGDSLQVKKDDLTKLKEMIESTIKQLPEFADLKDNVKITVTGEGLRIELMEGEKGMFFESGNARPTAFGGEFLKKLASEVGKLPNNVVIEGHTDAKPFKTPDGYTNWELSADRANAARSLMAANGLKATQVTQVRGFADQRPLEAKDSHHPSNRRISVIVQYMKSGNDGEKSLKEKHEEKAAAGHGEKKDSHGTVDSHGEKKDEGKKEEAAKQDSHGKSEGAHSEKKEEHKEEKKDEHKKSPLGH